jgi:hypothetical protein
MIYSVLLINCRVAYLFRCHYSAADSGVPPSFPLAQAKNKVKIFVHVSVHLIFSTTKVKNIKIIRFLLYY